MLRKIFLGCFCLVAVGLPLVNVASQTAPEARPSFAEPALSPDRAEIAFVSGGDIWTAPVAGGEARLLVSHPANEARPLYAPDGQRLAFVSSRTGNGDVYVLTFATGELKRLTFDDSAEQLSAWSRDGRWLYFSSTSQDIAGVGDVLRVNVEGGTPLAVTADRYANEFFAVPAPDGQSLAFSARGNAATQWWRKGHSHLDEAEIWVRREGASPVYEKLIERGAKNLWPQWSADDRSLFYVSDRSGAQNIWVKPLNGAARQLTQFKEGRVLWPNLAYDGKLMVFERDFGIWKLDPATGQTSEIKLTRRGVPAGPAVERLNVGTQWNELALAPDGRKVAVIAHGEVFAASAKEGGDATRVTRTHAAESQIVWSPDSKQLAYVSDRGGVTQLYLYDFAINKETALTSGAENSYTPSFAPDGKTLAFLRGGRELRALDLATKQERLLATGLFERPPLTNDRGLVWSHDSRWLAFLAVGERSFTNVNVVAAAGGERRQLSWLANAFGNTVSWSPDGRYILFNTTQRTEDAQLARIDLLPRTPKFREDQFRDLFKEQNPGPQRQTPPTAPTTTPPTASAPANAPKPEPKPSVEIVFDGLRQRLSFMPVGVNVGAQTISPDGKWVLLIASAEGQQNLYLYSLDELSREPAVARQLTSTPGGKSDGQFTPDSKEVYYLENGRLNIVNLDTRQVRPLALNADLEVDFAQEKRQVFQQAWSYLRDHFYDENFHGADWNAVRATYEPQIAGARTPDEMRRLLNLMVGELNASHLGASAPFGSGAPTPVGRLGLRFDRNEYEINGRLRITEILALSPVAIAGQAKVGDYLLAVDGVAIDGKTNLDELLTGKTGRRVELKIAASPSGTEPKEFAVQPVNLNTEKGLLYRQWVNEQRAYVDKTSNGRLGYVHMPDMSAQSLAQLYADLDADNHARAGVVVDIRNNSGGFVNAYAIDVFARRGYMTMTLRGYPAAPARSVLGQRALERPTILVTNQHSLSDAEDFTEGYRALKLGKVVGEPTSGWIIYTWNAGLIDGTGFRLPRMKVQDSQGKVMELNPRPVDVLVTRPIGEGYTGKDSQLDAAVRELLKQLDATAPGGRAASSQR